MHKTAISTPFGLWEFLWMPFGLRNARQTVQRLMHGILQGLPFTFVCIDDILIASRIPEDHLLHLRAVFQHLQDIGLIERPEKCLFGRDQLPFLGHLVSSEGISPLPEKVHAVQDFLRPSTIWELQRFLGL